MQGLVKPAISFPVKSHHELQKKKRIIQRNIPLRTYTPMVNPLLSVYSQITQILDQSLSSVTYPHVVEDPKALI